MQGCSIDGMVFGGSKKTATISATENRRVPDQNPTTEENKEPSKTQSDLPVQYLDDDNQQAYQDYKANDPPKDFKEFRKKQREAELKARRLDQSMDKEASAFKESQAVDKPIQIDGQSNLSEVIDYNKKRQAQPNDSKKTESVAKSSKVKKAINNNKSPKEDSSKDQSSEVMLSSSEAVNDNKKVTVVTIKSPTESTNTPKLQSKKKKAIKHSGSVTSKQQDKSDSDKKHKISVKPVVNKKAVASPAKAPVPPVIKKKDVVTKKPETSVVKTAEKTKVSKDLLKKDIVDTKTPATSSVNTPKVIKTPVPPVITKKDVVTKKPETSAVKTAEKTKVSKDLPKKDIVDAKIDTPIKVPEIFKDPIIDAPILSNKDEYNEVPTTYLVVDPSEVVDGSAVAEVPNVSDDVKLVNPLAQVAKPKTENPKAAKPKVDIRNLSHDEFKKALKEKFKKNNSGKYVNDAEIDNMSSVEIIDNNSNQ